MAFTYRELAAQLARLTSNQLDDDVTIYTSADDEYYPAVAFVKNIGDDVLHDGHMYFTIE